MKLVMDIGNSRIKWARVEHGELEPGGATDRERPLEKALDDAFGDMPAPDGVLISSVAGEDLNVRLEHWMVGHWGQRPGWFRARPETCGIRNGYAEPGQMGADRWAALVGARGFHPPPLAVIDCGTAVTLDVVDAADRHVGGLIAPGLELARRSLLTSTANVRASAPQATGLLGRNTAECVASGTSLGLAGAVERWIRDVERELDGVTWLATGGAWPRLRATIDRPIEFDPDLVLRGLARVLE